MFNRVLVESEGHTPFYGSLGETVVTLYPHRIREELETANSNDLIVLSGGVDIDSRLYGEPPSKYNQNPNIARDALCLDLWKLSRERNIPVLGICRGHQLIAALKGIKLIQHIGHDGGRRKVQLEGKFWASIPKCHHQAVPITKQLNILGKTSLPDGTEWIEAFTTEKNVLGVQGHPEWCDPDEDFPTWVRNKLWEISNVAL